MSSAVVSARESAPFTRTRPARHQGLPSRPDTFQVFCHEDPVEIPDQQVQGLHPHIGEHAEFEPRTVSQEPDAEPEEFTALQFSDTSRTR